MNIQKKICLYPLLVSSLLLIFLSTAYSENPEKTDLESKEYDIGISAGFWLPGTIWFEDVKYDKKNGLLLKFFADMYVAPKFAVGGYTNFSSFAIESADAYMYELGFALKPRFFISDNMAIKPGFNLGYRYMDWDYAGDSYSNGLALNLSVELHIAMTGGRAFLIDAGALSQPTGGNDYINVDFWPILYLCAGIVF